MDVNEMLEVHRTKIGSDRMEMGIGSVARNFWRRDLLVRDDGAEVVLDVEEVRDLRTG